MNLQHINLNELTDVTFKNHYEDEYPDYESAGIKSAKYKGVNLTRGQLKELNTNHKNVILQEIFKTVLA